MVSNTTSSIAYVLVNFERRGILGSYYLNIHTPTILYTTAPAPVHNTPTDGEKEFNYMLIRTKSGVTSSAIHRGAR